ncbi:PEP-CTERM sorting domain-containing protein [Paucibacter sp. APW11]|uniref:PEP-CTERM sorting domain-containing protein n=1 Tax=Roseateles aquae TaxID=3077235 RepID=A0ABU3PIF2_9BURK|nr:PEP-CTERM sorting domain-containing protein [Paucibacter sp. APW11]MDT9001888.1 PEP-CTERM sorting domain-containing protein [Paucibacter sp. APW11]
MSLKKTVGPLLLAAAALGAASAAQADTEVLIRPFNMTLNGVEFYRADTVLWEKDGGSFNLDSALLFEHNPWGPGAWGDEWGSVEAYRHGQLVGSKDVTLQFDAPPTRYSFNWTDIDLVLFRSGASSDGTFLAVSDMVGAGITQAQTVPEPSSYALLLGGLGLIGGVARRRRQR